MRKEREVMSLNELKEFSTKVYSRGRRLSHDLTSGIHNCVVLAVVQSQRPSRPQSCYPWLACWVCVHPEVPGHEEYM